MRIHSIRLLGAAMLLLGSAPVFAQLYQEEKGPGLDPTPLEIPAVTRTAPRPIRSMDLLSIRDLYGVSISPDGTAIAYVVGQAVRATNKYRSALFVVGVSPGSAPVNRSSLGPPFWKLGGQWFPDPPQWSPDSRSIAYRMKGDKGWQVWRWDRKAGAPVAITHCPLDVQSFRWSADGSRIVFEVYPPHDDAAVRAMSEGGVLFDQDFEATWDINKPVIAQKMGMKEAPAQTWVHDLVSSEERPATPEEVKRDSIWVRGWDDMATAEAAWSPDHKRLAYNKYLDDPALCSHSCYPLFVKDADGRNEKLLTPGVYYAGNPQWSHDGSEIYFERRDGDGRGATLSAVSPQGGAVRSLLPHTDHLGDCTWDRSKEHAACVVESNVSPPRVAFADLKARSLRVVADVNPEFQNLSLSSGTRIDWKNDDNMFAYLVKPLGYEAGKRYPLIVTTYRAGDGFLRGGVGDEYPIHVFAANGFAVLVFDCGAERNFKDGDFESAKSIWASPLEGIRSAIQIAVQMGVADPRRLGFTGLSHGSEIGAFNISHSDLFHAYSLSGSGSWDPGVETMVSKSFRHYLERWGLVAPDGPPVPERFQWLSATLNVDRIHAPLLMNVPDNEYINSLPLWTAMHDRRKPVEMWVYPDEYHEKIQPQHRYSVYERNVDWFRFWLKGEEDPNPAKKEQYERWHKLGELDGADLKERTAAN